MNANVPSAPDIPDNSSPLLADDFDRLFRPLNSFSKIALAVSGGADSTCLLISFADWRARTGWPGACEVLTVDHHLRPESRSEAEFVRALSEASGLPCRILDWSVEKPSSGLQEAARRARYSLIAAHMASSETEVLVLAHHLDDQAETFLDRLTRGSGLSGLAAMAEDEPGGPEGLRLVRPFLNVPKARLIATLVDRKQVWCEDRSNANQKYKRSRLRSVLSYLAEEGLTGERLAKTARQLRRARAALESVLGRVFLDHVEEHPAGPLRLPSGVYDAQAEEFRLRLLVMMIERVTGLVHQPRLRQIEALDRWVLSHQSGRRPLGGAMFEIRNSSILVWKEVGREAPASLEPVRGHGIWDNRFAYHVANAGALYSGEMPLCLGPLCRAPVDRQRFEWPKGWPRDAFECSPVVWTGTKPVAVGSAASLIWQGSLGTNRDITLQRIPVQPKLAGNYRMDLEGS